MALSSLAGAHLSGLGGYGCRSSRTGWPRRGDIGLALAFIPLLDASGAAIANAGGQAVHALVLLTMSRSRSAAAGGGSGRSSRVRSAPGRLCRGWVTVDAFSRLRGVLAGGAVFLAVYGVVALVIGVLTADDADWLERTVGGRLGGWVGRVAGRVTIRWAS